MPAVGTVRVVFQDDVTLLRDQVMRELQALTPCGGQLDPATFASWAEEEQIVLAWGQRVDNEVARGGLGAFPPSPWGQLYAEGRGIENVLRLNWWPRFTAAGCNLPPVSAPPEPALSSDNPTSPLAWLDPMIGMVKLLVAVLILREVREWTR